jgi:hypothetical protein
MQVAGNHVVQKSLELIFGRRSLEMQVSEELECYNQSLQRNMRTQKTRISIGMQTVKIEVSNGNEDSIGN